MPALRSSTGRGRRSLARSSAVPGVGAARTAKQTLLITLVTPEQRAASFAVGRVASNLGLGSGGTVAGFILASAQHLRSFQTLYLFDAITYAALALVVLAVVPDRRAAAAHAGAAGRGFRAVARDRRFLIVIAVNIVLIIVGYALFTNILPPYVKAHTRVGPGANIAPPTSVRPTLPPQLLISGAPVLSAACP
jgi:Major Facilitator Superfamily